MDSMSAIATIYAIIDHGKNLHTQAEKVVNVESLFKFLMRPDCEFLFTYKKFRDVVLGKIKEFEQIEELAESRAVLQDHIDQIAIRN